MSTDPDNSHGDAKELFEETLDEMNAEARIVPTMLQFPRGGHFGQVTNKRPRPIFYRSVFRRAIFSYPRRIAMS